jgi:hypothetical protein
VTREQGSPRPVFIRGAGHSNPAVQQGAFLGFDPTHVQIPFHAGPRAESDLSLGHDVPADMAEDVKLADVQGSSHLRIRAND